MNAAILKSLISRVRQGDRQAADQLYYALRPVVARFVRRSGTDDGDGTHLGRRIQALVGELPSAGPAGLPTGLDCDSLTGRICRQAVARLAVPRSVALEAAETVRF
jgi:hypothetical protein